MADQYTKPYLDSSVFIGWLKGEVSNGVDRKKIAEHILIRAGNGDFMIHISALTLAEVHKKRGHGRLTENEDEEILAFFENSFIVVTDVDRQIGEQANSFCREYGLSPADAIHLACALRAGCDVLLAWDKKLVAVKHPHIRCERPQMLGQLSLPTDDEGVRER